MKSIIIVEQAESYGSDEGTVRSDSKLLSWYFTHVYDPMGLEKIQKDSNPWAFLLD
jgi:hypothetical protein